MQLSAVESALPDLPTVLCTLIGSYAYPEPYEWKRLDSIRIINKSDIRFGNITQTTLPESNRRRLLRHIRSINYQADVFVSQTGIRDGPWKFKIAWKWTGGGQSVGVGMTTSSAHYTNTDRSSAAGPLDKRAVVWMSTDGLTNDGCRYVGDWTGFEGRSDFRFNSKPSTIDGFAADGFVDFVVDPDRMQVVFVPGGDVDATAVLQATTADEFWSLRPAVAVRNAVDVFIFSDVNG